jgi:hypothetical protein
MPLCITGMHRSGTSMVARLLNLCGLYLGPAKDMLPAAADNPEGFWEHRDFLRANDQFLKAAGGTWDSPPPAADGWESGAAFRRPRSEAARLVQRFACHEPWGWKDPRCCLTLPLWRAVLPNLKVLICVRSPLAVAASLWVRAGTSYAESLELWLSYNRRALAATTPSSRVVTHYESYFRDPEAELRRVLRSLDLSVSHVQVREACTTIKTSLVHHRDWTSSADTVGHDEVEECYRALCAEGAWGEEDRDAPREGEPAPSGPGDIHRPLISPRVS